MKELPCKYPFSILFTFMFVNDFVEILLANTILPTLFCLFRTFSRYLTKFTYCNFLSSNLLVPSFLFLPKCFWAIFHSCLYSKNKETKNLIFTQDALLSSGLDWHLHVLNIHYCTLYTDKKENKIFLLYKEIQMGSVAKSYMRKGFLNI
jgi:hypothetical protein